MQTHHIQNPSHCSIATNSSAANANVCCHTQIHQLLCARSIVAGPERPNALCPFIPHLLAHRCSFINVNKPTWLVVACAEPAYLAHLTTATMSHTTPHHTIPPHPHRLVAINVLMELVIAAAAVAKGFSDYLAALIMSLDKAGPHLLKSWSGTFALKSPCCSIDLVAMAAVLIITLLLVIGIKVGRAVMC